MAATTGFGMASSVSLSVHSEGPRIIAGVPNSRMSAPALNVPLPPMSTTPSTAASAAARSSAATSPERIACPRLLTGGAWNATTAIRPRSE